MTGNAGREPSSVEVRLAVVGVGHLGRHHARVGASLAGIRVVGIHDHHPGRAEEVSREFSIPVLPDLAAVADEAEAVVVATPTASHSEVAGFFLDRGLHVLVEKPIASDLSQADDLVARARRADRVLQVGHVERYNPAIEAALELVRSPGFVEVHRLGVFTARSLDVDVVLDLMIHDLQIVSALVGRPAVEVRAAGVPVLTDKLDIANARIAFEGGCVANLTASRVSAEKVRKLRVFAPSLYVSVDMQAQSVSAVRLARESGRPELAPVVVPVSREEPLSRELADFRRAVAEGSRPLVTGEDGRDALALAEEVVRAVGEHRHSLEEGPV
ncbi:MAG TPA: Gfo/Idh/MocA family oxidoreductase [Thermoanaerobaculia bacterium]|nr:Gfo/Idh/MocA family oxidoreductase [Thermoanaerobaculia bacterium]